MVDGVQGATRRPGATLIRVVFGALLAVALPIGVATAAGGGPKAAPGSSTTVRLCYNDQLGPPDGGHFSLQLVQAMQASMRDVRLQLEPLPWMRCLVLATRGEYDGIVGASFTVERALDLVYPRDAAGAADESKRLFSQGYRLLRRAGDPLDTDGRRFLDLTGPIGVERGHSSTSLARDRGAQVDDNHPDVQAMLEKLRRGRLGGALIAEPRLATLRMQPGALDGLDVVPTPLERRAYYLVLSREFTRRSPELAQRLWAEAARQRETPAIRRETARQQGENPP